MPGTSRGLSFGGRGGGGGGGGAILVGPLFGPLVEDPFFSLIVSLFCLLEPKKCGCSRGCICSSWGQDFQADGGPTCLQQSRRKIQGTVMGSQSRTPRSIPADGASFQGPSQLLPVLCQGYPEDPRRLSPQTYLVKPRAKSADSQLPTAALVKQHCEAGLRSAAAHGWAVGRASV